MWYLGTEGLKGSRQVGLSSHAACAVEGERRAGAAAGGSTGGQGTETAPAWWRPQMSEVVQYSHDLRKLPGGVDV